MSLIRYYVNDVFDLLVFCLVDFRPLHCKDRHRWWAKRDNFPLGRKDVFEKLIDGQRAEEYGDSQVSDSFKYDE